MRQGTAGNDVGAHEFYSWLRPVNGHWITPFYNIACLLKMVKSCDRLILLFENPLNHEIKRIFFPGFIICHIPAKSKTLLILFLIYESWFVQLREGSTQLGMQSLAPEFNT